MLGGPFLDLVCLSSRVALALGARHIPRSAEAMVGPWGDKFRDRCARMISDVNNEKFKKLMAQRTIAYLRQQNENIMYA